MNTSAHLTKTIQSIDAAHHIHPFTDMGSLNKQGCMVITGASGVYLETAENKKLLDGMAGLWCTNMGYGEQRIIDAVNKQLCNLSYYNTFFNSTHVEATKLAELIAELTPPNITHAFFTNSGSEANDTILRLVRHYWNTLGKPEKTVFISRKNAYHGSTIGGASLSGMAKMHAQGGGIPIPDIVHINQPYWYKEGGDLSLEEFGVMRARELEQAINDIGEERVAAFIAEPIQGAGGVVIPPSTYWPEVQAICKKYDILFVADEVICGFGRTGAWFGSNAFGLEPDIMTLAKGITSGYIPLGAVAVSQTVANTVAENGVFQHGYTSSGHPVACAAALANIAAMQEDNIVEVCSQKTVPYFSQAWKTLGQHPLVGESRSFGLLGAIELSADKHKRMSFTVEEGTVGKICRDYCYENGIVLRQVGDKMLSSPALIINHSQIDELISATLRSLDQTHHHIKKLGVL